MLRSFGPRPSVRAYFHAPLLVAVALALPIVVSAATPSFERLTGIAGLDAPYAALGLYGPGIACFDFEGDGDLDLFVPNEMSGHKLYRNDGGGVFTDIAPSLGLNLTTELPPFEDRTNLFEADPTAMMPCFVDTDNDGDLDFFLTCWNSYNRFFENVDGVYVDRTQESNLDLVGHSTTAAWGDYNGNGRLDVYITDWGGHDHLFANTGNNVWRDVSDSAGIYEGIGDPRAAWCAIWFDHNGDGLPDLYVGNDYGQHNQLYINQGGRFADQSRTLFPELQDPTRTIFQNNATMGQAFGDFDRDGDYDLFVANSLVNDLYQRRGNEYYDLLEEPEAVQPGGIAATLKNNDIGWDCEFPDVDNDGWIDLFLVNGYIRLCLYDDPLDPDCSGMGQPEQPNLLWMNQQGTGFTRMTEVAGLEDTGWGKGGIWADFDDDGLLDLFVTDAGSESAPSTHGFWRNQTANAGNYLKLHLTGTRSNRDAIGAEVRAEVGEVIHMRRRFSSTGYLSQDPPVLHFGLGDATTIDLLTIKWPSGQVDEFFDVDVNQTLYISEGTGGTAVPVLPAPRLRGEAFADRLNLAWEVDVMAGFDRFQVMRTRSGSIAGVVATIEAQAGKTQYAWTDAGVEPGYTYHYRIIGERDGARVESAAITLSTLSLRLAIRPATPNPFNPRTKLGYRIPVDADRVRLRIIDTRGRTVQRFDAGDRGIWQEVVWDGNDRHGRPVASGSYRFVVEADAFVESTTLTLVR